MGSIRLRLRQGEASTDNDAGAEDSTKRKKRKTTMSVSGELLSMQESKRSAGTSCRTPKIHRRPIRTVAVSSKLGGQTGNGQT